MGWLTPIRAVEQVEYRLTDGCGCDASRDAQVEYRLGQSTDLRWIGSGLAELGLETGAPVEVDAARALMDGRDWRTGEQLVRRKKELDPRGKLPARALVDALTRAAEAAGITPADHLRKPGLKARLGRVERGLVRDGDAHLLPIGDAERLADAAGLNLADVYGKEALTEANRWRNTHVDVGLRGVDVTLDLPKSFSLVYGLADEATATAIEEDWLDSITEAVDAMEKWTAYGMAGHHGDGQSAERIATSGLLGWTTLHRSARPVDDSPGDPHLHVHVNIAHLAKCEDGKWRTIAAGAEDLHRHARVVNELAEARMRARLIDRYGARLTRSTQTGAWELDGVPEELCGAFSRRNAQVLAHAGEGASRDQQKMAARQTAEAKEDSGDGPRAGWRERASVLLGSEAAVDAVVADALPGTGPSPVPAADGGGPLMPSPAELAVQIWTGELGLVASRKSVHRTHVMAAVAQAVPTLAGAAQLEALTDDVLAVDGHAVRLTDGGRIHQSHRQRYTHSSVIEAETFGTEASVARLGEGCAQLTAAAAEMAMDTVTAVRGFAPAPEQRAAIVRLLTEGHGVEALLGVAGSGKTTLMEVARTAWEAAGLKVVGASTAAVAAANLTAEAGIDSRTIATWTREISGGEGLDGVGVLVIDEAAMVDDRALAALLREAARTGTKVVAVGDPQQLRAIGVGGLFARIHQLTDGLAVENNRRQRDDVERDALATWRQGGRSTALSQLAGHGRVHATDTPEDAYAQMVAAWDSARTRWDGDVHDQVEKLLLLATRRADVDALNSGARDAYRAAGRLTGERRYPLLRSAGGGHLDLAVGDLVHVRRNDYRSLRIPGATDVLNGYRGVVLALDDERGALVQWRRPAAGGGKRLDKAWVPPDHLGEGRLCHGYAMTVASSQGLTCDVTIGYGAHADAHTLYPELTRAREATHLWLPLTAVEADVDRARLGEPRSDAHRLARAVTALGRQLDADVADRMVTDELTTSTPAPSPAVPQQPPAPEPARPAPRPTVSTQAARARSTVPDPVQPTREATLTPSPAAQADVPPWQQRQFGALPTSRLLSEAEKAEAAARHLEGRADSARAEATALTRALNDDITPGAAAIARRARHLDAAERLYDRADDVDRQLATAREANQRDREILRKIEAKAVKKLSALTFQRRSLTKDGAELERIVNERDTRIEDLRSQSAGLRRDADEQWAKGQPTEAKGRSSQARPDVAQFAASRDALPQLAELIDHTSRQDRDAWLRNAGWRQNGAAAERTRARALRQEATLREAMPAERHATETGERTAAATAKHAARKQRQAQLQAQHAKYTASAHHRHPPGPARGGHGIGR